VSKFWNYLNANELQNFKQMKKILLYFFIGLIAIVLFLFVYLKVFEFRANQISVGTLIQNYDSDNPALLVIDIQEVETGELSEKDYYKTVSKSLIRKTNKIAEAFEKKDAPVVYIKSEISDPILNLLNNSYKKGSRKAELDKRLLVVSNYIISKSRGDAFSNPQLDKLLIGKQVNHLIITGLDAAHCVNSTIQAAKNRGYMITVISDAVISKTDSIKQVKLKEFSRNGIEVVSSEDYLMELKKPE